MYLACSGTQMRPCVLWDTQVPVRALGHICTRVCSGTQTCPCMLWDTYVSLCDLGHMYVPVRALLGKNERQLCPGAALQGGIGDVVLDQPGDALGVAVRLLHQRHVVACA